MHSEHEAAITEIAVAKFSLRKALRTKDENEWHILLYNITNIRKCDHFSEFKKGEIEYDGSTAYVASKYLSKPGSASAASTAKKSISSAKEGTSSGSGDSMVWLSATGSKYHSRNDCGRMNPSKARQVKRSEAIAEGYEACKKCW